MEKSKLEHEKIFTPKFLIRVGLKAAFLFLACNLMFAAINPQTWLGKISGYNLIFPGRERLSWSENPPVAYNLSLNNLDAMFASHVVSDGVKPKDEYRVLVFGDSSVWGFYLTNEETLTYYINQADLVEENDKKVKVYNLGYPTISLTKDLLLMDYATKYEPDMVIWLVTLESFPSQKQLFTSLVLNNLDSVDRLIGTHDLSLNPEDDDFIRPIFWGRTIIGQRRPLADLFRLQLYGVMWAAIGIDQDIPEEFVLRQEDFEEDDSYYQFSPPVLDSNELAFDVLFAGIDLYEDIPVLIINEPIFISQGQNSNIRYNFFYPRWAYDSFRENISELSELNGWNYLDLWDQIPGREFTNTAIHLTPRGSALLAELVSEAMLDLVNSKDVSEK